MLQRSFRGAPSAKGKSNNDTTCQKYTAKEIVKFSLIQAKATYDAIDMFSVCEITDGNDLRY